MPFGTFCAPVLGLRSTATATLRCGWLCLRVVLKNPSGFSALQCSDYATALLASRLTSAQCVGGYATLLLVHISSHLLTVRVIHVVAMSWRLRSRYAQLRLILAISALAKPPPRAKPRRLPASSQRNKGCPVCPRSAPPLSTLLCPACAGQCGTR